MKIDVILGTETIIWQGDPGTEFDGLQLSTRRVTESIDTVKLKQVGGKVKAAGVAALGNPHLMGAVAALSVSAIQQYNKNKRNMTRFFARSKQEERFYSKVVDDLMKSGHYRKVNMKYVEGGMLWELERIE
jgi:hypothetical protein